MLRTLSLAATCVAFTLPLAAWSTAGGANDAKPAATPGAAPVAAGTAFRATGNEPSWRLDVSATEMSLLTDFGQTRVVAPAPTVAVAGATRTFVARSAQGEITATFVERVCMDTMSGMPHPQSVTVVAGGQTLTGCGGEPASLLQGAEWTVVSIDWQAARRRLESDAYVRAGRQPVRSRLVQPLHERIQALRRGPLDRQRGRHEDDVRGAVDATGAGFPGSTQWHSGLLDLGRRSPAATNGRWTHHRGPAPLRLPPSLAAAACAGTACGRPAGRRRLQRDA